MLIIKLILYFSAVVICLYPTWGIIDPTSYLNELIETFPFAQGASDLQVKKSALILLIPNTSIALSLVYMAKFISAPRSYRFANVSAILLILFPIIQSVGDIFVGSVLSQHAPGSSITIEFSSQKLFYILFGLAIWAIARSQNKYNKQLNNEE